MKTVSLKKLKEKGWELTPESKKAIREQNTASTLSRQVEAIANLAGKLDGIKDALRANTGKDYTAVIDRLTRSIKSIVIPQTAVIESESAKRWKCAVGRNQEGFISEIMIEKIKE